jgi:hypothetical protein
MITVSNQEFKDGVLIKEEILHLPTPIIEEVSMRQARISLLQNNLLTDVENIITNISGSYGEEAKITWEYATTVQRNSSFVGFVQQSLNLTDVAITELFYTASLL